MQILEHILKIRREKAKQKFSQTVGNQLATIANFAIWLPTSHCEFRIAKFCSHKTLFICLTRNVKSLAKFRIAKFAMCWQFFRNVKFAGNFFAMRNFAMRIFAMPISHCEIRNANFAMRISQSYQNSHCFALRFCFAHNFFIRTPFWAFLVPLESLESVESKYSQKEHF